VPFLRVTHRPRDPNNPSRNGSRQNLPTLITFLQRCRNTHLENICGYVAPSQLGATGRLLFLIHRNLPSRNAQRRARKQLLLDVVKLALGLGFFLVAVGYAHACERL
jgi:hypothetical protein